MKNTLLIFIKVYQKVFSSPDGFFARAGITFGACKFYPTCSEYSSSCIEKHGVYKGSILSIRRILRCHPFQEPKIDNVP